MKKLFIFLLVVLLTACSSKNTAMSDSYNNGYLTGGSYDAVSEQKFYEDMSSVKPGTSMQQSISEDRKQILYATISYRTEEFDTTIEELLKAVNGCGGYVQSGNLRNQNTSSRYAEYVLRIPVDAMESVIDSISTHAELQYRTDKVDDITQAYTDTEMHIEMLEVEYERLLVLMQKAEKIEDILTIEQRLTEIRYQLENYKVTLQNYDLQVAYSTITIYIQETTPVVMTTTTIWEEIQYTFTNSVETIIQTAQAIFVGIVGNILYIVLFTLAAVLGIKLIKKVSNRVSVPRVSFKKFRKNKEDIQE